MLHTFSLIAGELPLSSALVTSSVTDGELRLSSTLVTSSLIDGELLLSSTLVTSSLIAGELPLGSTLITSSLILSLMENYPLAVHLLQHCIISHCLRTTPQLYTYYNILSYCRRTVRRQVLRRISCSAL